MNTNVFTYKSYEMMMYRWLLHNIFSRTSRQVVEWISQGIDEGDSHYLIRSFSGKSLSVKFKLRHSSRVLEVTSLDLLDYSLIQSWTRPSSLVSIEYYVIGFIGFLLLFSSNFMNNKNNMSENIEKHTIIKKKLMIKD